MSTPARARHAVALIDNLAGAAEASGIHLIDRRFGESFTSYPEFYRRIRRQANRLAALGVRPGQRVAISLATDLDVISCFLGLIYMGAVPVSVHQPLVGQAQEAYLTNLASLIRAHKLDRLVLSERLAEVARAERIVEPELIAPCELPLGGGEWPEVAAAACSPDDLAMVQFSSGSTARPKGVLITHQNLVYNLGLQVDHDSRAAEHVAMTWLPLCHH